MGSIMFQGTASGVGKSTLTMALCRVLANKGIKVAPFKAQNMTSNSTTLENNKIIATSQVMQAIACKIKPDERMNPILLKPLKDGGCEVIVKGESWGSYLSSGYNNRKKELKSTVLDCYNELLSAYEVVVAEGSGSPCELNLIKDDVANMGFATAANCPVIIVGDISRGGVFASIYGTIMLFNDEERKLVKGSIVNKLKGKAEYFEDGKEILLDKTGVECLGVLPHLSITLEDEDDLTDDGIMKTKEIIENTLKNVDYNTFREEELDKLANELLKHIEFEKIWRIIKGED